ncbi:MAG: ribonuclease HII [Fervidicoccaceae archaeon]|jgi:ribonuclease HII
MKLIMGMDEAGRGSLIGPMVVAAVIINERAEEELKKMGVTDSKKLSRKKREQLYEVIINLADWHDVVLVQPEQIDSNNLNMLTIEAFRQLACSALLKGYIPDAAIADAVGRIELEFYACVQIKVRMEKKADSKYTAVGAASIVAKVIRDREIEKIRNVYGLEGSGYPGDKRTVAWILKNSKALPPFLVRHKWRSKANPYFEKGG